MATSKFSVDDDLQDLIGDRGSSNNNNNSNNASIEMKPLNLEHLSQGDLDVPLSTKRSYDNNQNRKFSILQLCFAYLSFACDYAPRCCWALAMIALIVPSYVLITTVFFNPTETFGVVSNDYTNIRSQYDLSVGKIDHWCLKGGNDSCRCEDPLEPQSRGEFRAWAKAQAANRNKVQALLQEGRTNPDIAFLGGSVVEEMDGTWFGKHGNDDNLKTLETLFQKNFQTSQGADLDAVALGIAGDTNPTVLWRLMNGEMPDAFHPKIWWLEVGLNDLGRSQCSEEVVVLGILRIVEEILAKHGNDGTQVVINSLFPLADLRGGLRPGQTDFKDSFNKDLRTKTTDAILRENEKKMKKEHHGKRNKRIGGTNMQEATDFGDATHISHLKENPKDGAKKKHDKKKKKSKKHDTRFNRRSMLAEDNRVEEAITMVNNQPQRLLFGRHQHKSDITLIANKDKQKKFNPITRHERKLPLWTSITVINKELKKFASKNENVHFFDATDIFTDREDQNTYNLNTEMISVRGHPTKKGFEKWEKAVIKKAKVLLGGE